MKLLELFDTPAKWRFTDNSETDAVVEFEVNGVQYVLTLWTIGQYGNWGVEFENLSVAPDNRFGITGQGNASTVFATVCDILKNFKSRRDVYTMGFMAEEPNRRSLYKRIIKTVFPGWAISEDGSMIEVERKGKYNEGKMKDLAYNTEWDRQNSPGKGPTIKPPKMEYKVVINGKAWKEFSAEKAAMAAANSLYYKNKKLRINVVPI